MPLVQRQAPADPHNHETCVETIGPLVRPYAMVFRRAQVADAQFLSPPSFDFRDGMVDRTGGFSVRAHQQPERARTQSLAAEFLYLERGRVRVRVFDEEWHEQAAVELRSGEMVLLLRGGHTLEVLARARIVGVRQGRPGTSTRGEKLRLA